MLLAIIIAFILGGSVGFFLACLVCSGRTTHWSDSLPERFYQDPLRPVSGKFLVN
jgi:hypothetical protein